MIINMLNHQILANEVQKSKKYIFNI